MLTVNRLGEDAGRYYLDGTVTGRWCGAGRHDLGLDGPVTAPALTAVLRGRHPDEGGRLCRRHTPHRRAGWDLILTAPKSLSLAAALAPPPAGAALRASHLRAVADAFGWLERIGAWARRGGALVASTGFVAARYGHEHNTAGEPHLHTHVLVANLACSGGTWSAVDGGSLWLHRRSVAAIYHLALRRHVIDAGYPLAWTVHADGSADLAAVPRAAIEATSSRRRHIVSELSTRDEPSVAERSATQRRSRTPEPVAGDRSWVDRSEAAGFGPDAARRLVEDPTVDLRRGEGRPTAGTDGPGEADRRIAAGVVDWLAERRSSFGVPDVLQALAATSPTGAGAADADRWAADWCRLSPGAPGGRWTSRVAMAADADLVATFFTAAGRDLGLGDPSAVGRDGAGRPVHGQAVTTVATRLVAEGDGIAVLGPGPGGRSGTSSFVVQASVIDAARAAWMAAGHTVGVAAPSAGAARRWRALAGIDRADPGGRLPSVLVVDRADRVPTPQLGLLLETAGAAGTKVVLVVGGTLPARRRALSEGLEAVSGRFVQLGPEAARRDPGRPASASDIVVGRYVVAAGADRAIDRAVQRWAEASATGRPAMMVALGPAECEELNRLARAERRATGAVEGPDAVLAGRPFALGDEVVALRRGPATAGTVGRVVSVDPAGVIGVRWPDGEGPVDRWSGRRIGHAYATTPALARHRSDPVVLLGQPSDLGAPGDRLVAAVLVAGAPGRAAPWPLADAPRHVEVAAHVRVLEAEAVAGGPGPAPDDLWERRAWRSTARRYVLAREASRARGPSVDRAPSPHRVPSPTGRAVPRLTQPHPLDGPDLGR